MVGYGAGAYQMTLLDRAVKAAQVRARELGDEFGSSGA